MWKHWRQYLQPNLAKQDTEFMLLRYLFSVLLLETTRRPISLSDEEFYDSNAFRSSSPLIQIQPG